VGDPVHDRVLDIVAAETGYPPDMLDLDLDLEADLGIDTVKQAEMFAAIREEWGIERDDSVALRDYPTLQHVIEFVYERTDLQPAAATPAPAPTAAPATAAVEATVDLIRGDDAAAAAIPRRVPGAVLRPSLEMTRATHVALDDSSRVIVMADAGGVGKALARRLNERGVDVLVVEDSPAADDLLGRIDAWAAGGGVTGVYWLPALDREDPIAEMAIADWKEALRVRVKLLYRTMRHLYDRVGGTGTFLVSATRLGGQHGYDGAPPLAPMGGGVTGFTKTYKREKPDALVKAVDFAPSRKTAALADTLIAETLRDPGAVEIGIDGDVRWTVGLTDAALPDEATGLDLGPDSVFVVTGAAGSIVSAITADLAANSRGMFHLLDLVPEPDPSDPDIAAFSADKDTLKRTIFDRLKASGERATPAMVDKELARIERAHAALSAIRAVEEAGGTARYHSVNLLDAAAMATVTDLIAATNDRVDVLLHAGGLEISRLLPDKEPDEYDLVFDVKADGWFNLLRGLSDVPIGATVAFSSIAGRFGNAGQADYSAANDLLCKWALGISAVRPETTGIAIDWTAWGDIGMATRGSIPTVMKAAGIDMLPAAAGIPIVRREVIAASGSREMVAGLQLGMLLEEWEEDGGVDLAALAGHSPDSPMSGRVTSFGINDGLTMVTTLDPEVQPFLNDHRIDGTPVLPGVMGVEAFAAAALAGFPDRHVSAIEAVAFTAPFKFYRDEPREVTVKARFRADGDEIVADCRLIGVRTIAAQAEPQVTTHFTGRVRLGRSAPDLGTGKTPVVSGPTVSADDIYRIYFHGPAYQVLDEAWRSDGAAVGRFAEDLPPNNIPAEQGTITDPRLLELCFQTAGVWEIGTTGQMALPMHIDRVVTMPASGSAEREYATMTASDGGAFVGSVVDRSGRVRVRLEGYLTVPLPGAIGAEDVAPLRAAMSDD
jgi:NADP-dependent 3-hydroxy acid dehydrogenase YdfG/acyl carrier protein